MQCVVRGNNTSSCMNEATLSQYHTFVFYLKVNLKRSKTALQTDWLALEIHSIRRRSAGLLELVCVGGGHGPSVFDRSGNPISTGGWGRLCSHITICPPSPNFQTFLPPCNLVLQPLLLRAHCEKLPFFYLFIYVCTVCV